MSITIDSQVHSQLFSCPDAVALDDTVRAFMDGMLDCCGGTLSAHGTVKCRFYTNSLIQFEWNVGGKHFEYATTIKRHTYDQRQVVRKAVCDWAFHCLKVFR